MWEKNEKGVWSNGPGSTIWIEPESGAIMVRVVYGTDPEELNADEARGLSALLAKLADEADALDLNGSQLPQP